PAWQEQRFGTGGRPRAALHFDGNTLDRSPFRPDGLQKQRQERDATANAVETQMHQSMIDLEPSDPDAVRDRAARVGDLELHPSDLAGYAPHQEAEATLGEGEVIQTR